MLSSLFALCAHAVILLCRHVAWEEDPDKQPAFSNIVTSVEEIMAPLANYLDFTEFLCSNKL